MAWWSGWGKYAAAGVGGIAGFLLGGPAGAVAGASAGYGIVNAIETGLEEQADANQNAEFATTAATDTTAQQAIENQGQKIRLNQNKINTSLSEQQRATQASNISEQSRAAAIDNFQAQSAGEAALGTSGMAAGSSPYLALESQMGETSRKLDMWFKGSAQELNISGTRLGLASEGANLDYRTSDVSQSILGHQVDRYRYQATQFEDAASNLTLIDHIAGGVLQSVNSAYQLGSSVNAMGLMANGGQQTGFQGFLPQKYNPLVLGGAVQYGQASGDLGPLKSLYAPSVNPLSIGAPSIPVIGGYAYGKMSKSSPLAPILGGY
jgi:hypothetical protein